MFFLCGILFSLCLGAFCSHSRFCDIFPALRSRVAAVVVVVVEKTDPESRRKSKMKTTVPQFMLGAPGARDLTKIQCGIR